MDPDALHFRGRYRIPSTRRRGWDYADAGLYFVTVCTKGKYPWFGEIRGQIMGLSKAGAIVDTCLKEIPEHFPHVSLDWFVVMPNHVHGIVALTETRASETCASHVSTGQNRNTHRRDVPRGRLLSDVSPGIPRPPSGSLGSVINQFKTACTKRIRPLCPDFAWQPRFHDRIIRDEDELVRIRQYITGNPLVWEQDDLFISS